MKRYQPKVVEAKVFDFDANEKDGIYSAGIKLSDQTECRLFYNQDPKGKRKIMYVKRLEIVPCPVCLIDYHCNCMDRYKEQLLEQAEAIIDKK